MAFVAARFRDRIFSANGNQLIEIGTSQTGQFEDITNTSNTQPWLEINYLFQTYGVSGSVGISHIGMKALNTDPLTALKDPICHGVIPRRR